MDCVCAQVNARCLSNGPGRSAGRLQCKPVPRRTPSFPWNLVFFYRCEPNPHVTWRYEVMNKRSVMETGYYLPAWGAILRIR